jgi:predicted nucleotidyltransferase
MLNSLLSKSKRKILGLLFSNPERSFYLREIMRMTGVSQGTLHRELKPLVADGILISEKKGNQVHYSVNRENPIFSELKAIVLKTFGLAETLKETLKSYNKKIKVAFLYGSIPCGEDTAGSDIDLMIIGKATFLELAKAFNKAEKSLGRTVNPTIYPVSEFRRKAQSDNHFIKTVLNSPLNFLIGNIDDLRKLAGK